VGAYQAGAEPTVAGVAARLTAITATTLLTGGIIGVGLVGGASGLTSSLGVKRDGVYADCRCLVVRSVCHDDGCIELYFAVEETLDEKTGAVKSSKTLMMAPEPRVTVKGAVAPPVTVFNSSSAIPVAHGEAKNLSPFYPRSYFPCPWCFPSVLPRLRIPPSFRVSLTCGRLSLLAALDTYTLQVDCASQDNQLAEVSIVNQLRHPTDRIVDVSCICAFVPPPPSLLCLSLSLLGINSWHVCTVCLVLLHQLRH
jgi:hypothetical protein